MPIFVTTCRHVTIYYLRINVVQMFKSEFIVYKTYIRIIKNPADSKYYIINYDFVIITERH